MSRRCCPKSLRLEWTLSEVFDAEDAPAIDRSALACGRACRRGAGLQFVFHPSLRQLEFLWNTDGGVESHEQR